MIRKGIFFPRNEEERKMRDHYNAMMKKASFDGKFYPLGSMLIKLFFLKYIFLNKDALAGIIKFDDGFSWQTLSEKEKDLDSFIDSIFENLAVNNDRLSALKTLYDLSETRARRHPADRRYSKNFKERSIRELIAQLNKKSEYNERAGFNKFASTILKRRYIYRSPFYEFGSMRMSEQLSQYIESFIFGRSVKDGQMSIYDPLFADGEIYYGFLESFAGYKGNIKIVCNSYSNESPGMLLMMLIINGIYNVELLASPEFWFKGYFLNESRKTEKYDVIIASVIGEEDAVKDEETAMLKSMMDPSIARYTDEGNLLYNFLIDSMNDSARMVLITNYSFLTSSGNKYETRKFLVENDWISKVISVYGFMYSSGSVDPAVVLVDKNKDQKSRNKTEFIDLERFSKRFDQHEKAKFGVENLINAAKGISHALVEKTEKEIEENNFNLNVFKYLPPISTDPEEAIGELTARIQKSSSDLSKKIDEFTTKVEKMLSRKDE